MGELREIAYVLLLVLDLSIIPSLRTALLECCHGKSYHKKGRRINRDRPILDRITLNYIPPLLKKYKREFHIIHLVYKTYLIISPCLSLLIPLSYIFFGNNVYFILFAITCFLKFLLGALIRIILFPHGEVAANSIFIQKKPRK